MKNLKYTITRAYSQKFGDYNKEWDSSSHTIEISLDEKPNPEDLEGISDVLNMRAQKDVQRTVRKLQERNPEQEAEANLNFDLSVQDEADYKDWLAEANKNLNLK